jgi:hypothetical protein
MTFLMLFVVFMLFDYAMDLRIEVRELNTSKSNIRRHYGGHGIARDVQASSGQEADSDGF